MDVPLKPIRYLNPKTLRIVCRDIDRGYTVYQGQLIKGEHKFTFVGRPPNLEEGVKWADGKEATIVADYHAMGQA